MRKLNLSKLWAIASLWALSSCGAPPAAPSHTLAAETCPAAVAAFQSSVFPLVREHCALCHDGTGKGPVRGPAFAVADPLKARSRILALVDAKSLKDSTLVVVGGNHHCLSRGGPADCGASREELRAAVETWWGAGEQACAALGVVTTPLVLPSDLPVVGFRTLRWDLGALDRDLAGVKFELEAQHFVLPSPASKGAYRFRAPRLGAAGKALAVSGIKVAINGTYAERSNEYAHISRRIGPKPEPQADQVSSYPALSTFALIQLQNKPAGDTIQIGFDQLTTTAVTPCTATSEFAAIERAMEARSCYLCHGGGPSRELGRDPARRRWSLAGDQAALCQAVAERTDPVSPTTSVFLSYALRGVNGHPRVFATADEIMPAYTAWIDAETALR